MSPASATMATPIHVHMGAPLSLFRTAEVNALKGVSRVKLLGSLLAATQAQARVDAAQAFLYTHGVPLTPVEASGLFKPHSPLACNHLPLAQLLELIRSWWTPTCLAFYEHASPTVSVGLRQWAETLHHLNPHWQQQSHHQPAWEAPPAPTPEASPWLVLQQRPGTLKAWDPRASLLKRLRRPVPPEPPTGASSLPPLVDVGAGVGAGCGILWSGPPGDARSSHQVTLQSLNYLPGPHGSTTCQLATFATEFRAWLEGLNAPDSLVVYLSSPFPALAQGVAAALKPVLTESSYGFRYPEHWCGYSPRVAFLEFLLAADPCGVFIDLGAFPEILSVFRLKWPSPGLLP